MKDFFKRDIYFLGIKIQFAQRTNTITSLKRNRQNQTTADMNSAINQMHPDE